MTRYAYITRGAFANRRAEILADRGAYAHLAVESGVLIAPETDFIRLPAIPFAEPSQCITVYHELRYIGPRLEAGRPEA